MPNAVTDTHALIWYLQNDARLSAAAGRYFDECEYDGGRIYVPSICVVEMIYLSEKGRISVDTLTKLLDELAASDTIFEVSGLSLSVALKMREISREAVPDMPDRIIAATASHLRVPLMSRDRKIQLSGVETVW